MSKSVEEVLEMLRPGMRKGVCMASALQMYSILVWRASNHAVLGYVPQIVVEMVLFFPTLFFGLAYPTYAMSLIRGHLAGAEASIAWGTEDGMYVGTAVRVVWEVAARMWAVQGLLRLKKGIKAMVRWWKGVAPGLAAEAEIGGVPCLVVGGRNVVGEASAGAIVSGDWSRVLEEADVVVVHFHGGGFVCMHPTDHLAYLQAWVGQEERAEDPQRVVIVSVDYPLAPENPFPAALNAASAVYAAVVAARNGSGDKITVVGDSAGGNLSAALTIQVVQEGVVAPPERLVLVYPSLFRGHERNGEAATSLALDPVLPTEVFNLMRDAYLPEGTSDEEARTNVLLSPGAVDASTLQSERWPAHMSVYCGEVDPLLDDTNQWIDVCARARVDLVSRVYPGLCHGFLNLVEFSEEAKDAMLGIGRDVVGRP